MTVQEAQKVIEELKAQGNSEEEIAGSFYLLFRENKIDVEQLEGLVNLLGYHLTEEFKAMDPEQQKNEGYEMLDEEHENEPQSQSQPQEEKEEEPEDDEEDEAMNLMGLKDKQKEPTSKSENEEDDEEEKAKKLFG